MSTGERESSSLVATLTAANNITGVGVTVISAILPARRAVRIAPVAALVDHSEGGAQSLPRGRVLAGVVVAIAGVGAVLAGLTGPTIALVGAGAVAVFVAAGMLVPLIAQPMASALGRPLAVRGTPGRLARENAMRNPRRTAQTAAADDRPGGGVDDRGARGVPERFGGQPASIRTSAPRRGLSWSAIRSTRSTNCSD